jgi:6-phosphogluconolactonase
VPSSGGLGAAGASGGSSAGGPSGAGGTIGSGAAGSAGAAGSSGGKPGSGGSSGASGGGGSGGAPPLPTTAFVYVGSGNYSGSNGAVSLYKFDYAAATLTFVDRVSVGGLASFLAIDAQRNALFIADEADGNLRRLSLDPVSHVPSRAAPSTSMTSGHPVHVSVTGDGRFVLVAHYNEGKAESFGVDSGALTASLDLESPGSQAHAAVLAPDERFVFVPCKGSDRVARFAFDGATGMLSPVTPAVSTQSGDGPRHLAFHPNGTFAYVVNELSSTVIAYAYTTADGSLSELMRTTTLPQGFSGSSTGAEIAVSPSGDIVYASNRFAGANGDIVTFRVAADGKLTLVGHQSTGGHTPRSFALDPTGRFLFAGNQDSNSVAVLAIDASTGTLSAPATTDVGVNAYFVGVAPFTD